MQYYYYKKQSLLSVNPWTIQLFTGLVYPDIVDAFELNFEKCEETYIKLELTDNRRLLFKEYTNYSLIMLSLFIDDIECKFINQARIEC